MKMRALILLLFVSLVCALDTAPSLDQSHISANAGAPNIILLLVDDQDWLMNSMRALPKLKELIVDEGATMTRSYVTTPVCCPSRASIYTGKYQHNTGVINNTADGECWGSQWVHGPEKETLPVYLNNHGYRTSFAGKYLNGYNKRYVPPGWTQWLGLFGNSVYYNYNISDNGEVVHHGDHYATDYLTDLVANRTEEFLRDSFSQHSGTPVFAVASAPAPHDPNDAAPQYTNSFSNVSAPKPPNFNYHSDGKESKHWLIDWDFHYLSESTINFIDEKYRKRLRTLASVDDMVSQLVAVLKEFKQLDNTYFMYFSDNGYHLGQFCMVFDKRMPYEFDIQVPFFIRGPGIPRGSQVHEIALNIDIAPTLLDLAGIPIPASMDGISLKSALLHTNSSPNKNNALLRTDFVLEYTGEWSVNCSSMWPGCCANNSGNLLEEPWCIDTKNNTYVCLRTIDGEVDTLYCEFDDDVQFKEYYDLREDPYQLHNAAFTVNSTVLEPLSAKLHKLKTCVGSKQCNLVSASS